MTDAQAALATIVLQHGLAQEDAGTLVRTFFSPEPSVDPTTSDELRVAGNVRVTECIERLGAMGLVEGATPLLTSSGPFIGYRLTEKGREVARLPDPLSVLRPGSGLRLPAGVLPEVATEQVNLLGDEAGRAMAAECWLATIMVCGRIVETVVLGLSIRECVLSPGQQMNFQPMIRGLRERGFHFERGHEKLLDLVWAFRNRAVHPDAAAISHAEASEVLQLRFPTREEAEGVVGLTIGILQRVTARPSPA